MAFCRVLDAAVEAFVVEYLRSTIAGGRDGEQRRAARFSRKNLRLYPHFPRQKTRTTVKFRNVPGFAMFATDIQPYLPPSMLELYSWLATW